MPSSFQLNANNVLIPAHPVLFIHGINNLPADNYWNTVKAYLQTSLGWKYGGVLSAVPGSVPASATLSGGLATGPGDFYTVLFSDPLANAGGIERQGDEVDAFINRLWTQTGSFPKVSLLAHSMGGLASRRYLQGRPDGGDKVAELITYGTPHLGILSDNLKAQYNLAKSTKLDQVITLFGYDLAPELNSTGFAEMSASCDGTSSSFLADLNSPSSNSSTKALPAGPRYKFIAGINDGISPVRALPLGPRFCPSFEDTSGVIYLDGVVPLRSADPLISAYPATQDSAYPRSVLPPSLTTIQEFSTLHTGTFHADQPSDMSTLLCALATNCMVIQAHSPVDIDVVQPDGAKIGVDFTQIPGAGLQRSSRYSPARHGGGNDTVPRTWKLHCLSHPEGQCVAH